MRVPKKSTATYKKAYFFHPILPAHPIFPAFSAFSALPPVPLVPQSPVRLALPPVPSVSLVPPVSPVSLVPPISLVSLVPALPIFSAFSALSEKNSSIPSLYFRYKKDIGSPKDYRKMSEAQTSNHRLKTRKTSYANLIHNLFRFSHSSQSFQPSHLSHLTKKILCNCRKN